MAGDAVVPSSFHGSALWPTALPLTALTFVHVILLPALIWPGHDLTARGLAKVLALALAIPLIALLSVGVNLCTSFILVMFLLPLALFLAFPLFFTGFAVGCSVAGATCCGLAAWVAKMLLGKPGQVVVRTGTAVLGGGAAALVLFVFAALPELKQIANDEAVIEPEVLDLSLLSTLAGLPHLLLMCRDLARQPSALAALPVAARRFCVALALMGCSIALLLTAHGRS